MLKWTTTMTAQVIAEAKAAAADSARVQMEATVAEVAMACVQMLWIR